MKKFGKLICLVSAAAMLLTACSGGGENSENVALTKVGSTQISEKPMELTIFSVSGDKLIEEQDIFLEAAKLTNVSLKTTTSRNVSDHNQAFNILMASENLPDIVKYINRDYFLQYGEEGAFEPLEDLIDKYAPNLKKAFEDEEVRKYATASDGHIYFIPMLQEPRPQRGWIIRQDWLDKLGLEQPKTVEEYHDVLKAFADNDMNGNGRKDEVPYLSRFTDGVNDLLGLWGAFASWNAKDGKVFYGPMQEEYKTAYTNIGQWYKEGLIDKEIYTRGSNARNELFAENCGGSTHDWFGTTLAFNDTITNIPGFKLSVIAPPNGVEYTVRQKANATGWAISSTSKNKEAAIRYMDFWFSEEGSRLINYGIEGVTYDMVDGVPTFKDEILKNTEKSVLAQIQEYGAQDDIAYSQDFAYEEQWLSAEAKDGMAMYEQYLTEQFPTLSYTKEEKSELDDIMGNIKTYVDEISQKYVFGSLDASAHHDEFISTLKSMKIDRAIEIQQTAYDRYKK